MTNWRNNMWVMTKEGVGILFNMDHFPSVVIHLVNDDGTTITHLGADGKLTNDVWFNIDVVRQAKYLEIPKVRRGKDKKYFTDRGYN